MAASRMAVRESVWESKGARGAGVDGWCVSGGEWGTVISHRVWGLVERALLDMEPLLLKQACCWLGPRVYAILKGEQQRPIASWHQHPDCTPTPPWTMQWAACLPPIQWVATYLAGSSQEGQQDREISDIVPLPRMPDLALQDPVSSRWWCAWMWLFRAPSIPAPSCCASNPCASTLYTWTWLTWTLCAHSPCMEPELQGPIMPRPSMPCSCRPGPALRTPYTPNGCMPRPRASRTPMHQWLVTVPAPHVCGYCITGPRAAGPHAGPHPACLIQSLREKLLASASNPTTGLCAGLCT